MMTRMQKNGGLSREEVRRQEAPHQGARNLFWNCQAPCPALEFLQSQRPPFVADSEEWSVLALPFLCASVCFGGGWTFLSSFTSFIGSGDSCIWDPTLCKAGVGAWALELGWVRNKGEIAKGVSSRYRQ